MKKYYSSLSQRDLEHPKLNKSHNPKEEFGFFPTNNPNPNDVMFEFLVSSRSAFKYQPPDEFCDEWLTPVCGDEVFGKSA